MGLGTQLGEPFAFCTKHKSGQAYALPSTIFKSFKPEDLYWANSPFPFLFLGEKKINYAIVYTPRYIQRRGISILQCPGVNWGYFSAFGFLWMYVLITHPVECNPHIGSEAAGLGVCGGGGLCLPYVASAQSGKLSSCFPLGNKAIKSVLFIGTAHILERFLPPQQT